VLHEYIIDNMYPLILSIGFIHIYSLSVFLVLSWGIFSFLLWRGLRGNGVDEDKIFDLTFYSTLCSLVVARVAFVVTHWDIFQNAWLKIPAIWIAPGFSLYGALIGGLVSMVIVGRKQKVRIGQIFDTFALAFSVAYTVGLTGSFLDGSVIGKISRVPWAVRYIGEVGTRHPIQIYESFASLGLIVFVIWMVRKSVTEKWAYGVVGVWFFLIYSPIMFALESFKDSHVYWSLSANQWVLVALFAETVGAFYVHAGGREKVRPVIYKIKTYIARTIGGLYAKFPRRHS